MGLDALYGDGQAGEFERRVDISAAVPGSAASIVEHDCEDGSVWLEVTWTLGDEPVASYRLECRPGEAHCPALVVAPAYRGRGILDTLTEQLLDWFGAVGVVAHTAAAASARSALILERVGFHFQRFPGETEERFGMRCDEPDRAHEYVAWLRADRQGPPPPWLEPQEDDLF